MIVAFVGDNGHAREQAAREFIDGFTGVHGTVAVDRFSADELDLATLSDAIGSVPFLSERRLVIVRDISANKQLVEQFPGIAELVADQVDFVIIEGHVDGRSKYLTLLKNVAEVREFNHLEGDSLVDWLVMQVKDGGGAISRSVAQELIDRVGTNQQLLANELAKLLLFNATITSDTVTELTAFSPQSSIFAMLDATFSGQVKKSLQLYHEQRVQGMEPQAILAMIIWQLHIITIVKAGEQLPVNDIATQAKISPFVIRKNQTNVRRISRNKLLTMITQTIKTDRALKTTRTNADEAVQTLLVSFS